MLKTMTVRATIAAILAGLSMSAYAIADSPKTVDIPAGDLRQALLRVSEQFGTDLVYRPEQVDGIKTRGAHGELTTEQAITKLLEGTRLELRTDPSGAILIAPPAVSNTSSSISSEGRGTEGEDPEKTTGEARPGDSPQPQKRVEVEEVVVTGSHIRGADPVGSHLIVITREDIEKSGYGRIEDVMASLPQNFGNNNDFNGSSLSVSNLNGASEIQLRGLGSGTTLTLVNGQRQAAGGMRGAFVDVSSIPLSAIERIEVLPDGASAIYGSDAVGGVVNIVLRRDYQGAESRVQLSTASGEGDERQVSQLLGTNWQGGRALFGYQYYQRDDVPAASREYSARNGDMRAYGGSDFRELSQLYWNNPVTILNPLTAQPGYTVPRGQDGRNLTTSDLIPGFAGYTDTVSNSQILPRQVLRSAFFSAAQNLTPDWELTLDGRFSTRHMDLLNGPTLSSILLVPSSNPFYVNPYESILPGLVAVDYDFTKDLGPTRTKADTDTYDATFGIAGQLTPKWRLSFNGSYAREKAQYHLFNSIGSPNAAAAIDAALADSNPATALNVFGDGSHTNPATLATIRELATVSTQGTSDVRSAALTADGPLVPLPGGEARLALGLDYRHEKQVIVDELDTETTATRGTTALFAELALPFVSRENARPGLRRLELSLAGRYEHYTDFGSTFDPKIGLSYAPLSFAQLRGTWGTSFRAPPFYQSAESLAPAQAFARRVVDTQSPTGTSRVLLLFGNNSALTEETATTWTGGIDFTIPEAPNAKLSLTYFHINYKDKIEANTPDLSTESQWAGLIERNPSQAEIDAICTSGHYEVFGSCTSSPIVAILDSRQRNTAIVRVRGIDADLRNANDTAYGRWTYGLGGTYTLTNERAFTASAPLVDVLDTVHNPLALRLRGSLAWTRGSWNVGTVVNYTGSYHDISTTPETTVGSWTTLDLEFAYAAPPGSGWLDGTRVGLNAVNVFDTLPPFVNLSSGYDAANATILGRLLSLQVSKAW